MMTKEYRAIGANFHMLISADNPLEAWLKLSRKGWCRIQIFENGSWVDVLKVREFRGATEVTGVMKRENRM